MSTELDFWNSVEVIIFSELIFTSAEFNGILFAKFRECHGIPGESYTEFRKKYRNYCILETWNYGKWKYGHGDKETWRNVNMETWRNGDMDT
jgi:hypothetical protein